MTPPTQSNVEALLEKWRDRADDTPSIRESDTIRKCIAELEDAIKADREEAGK